MLPGNWGCRTGGVVRFERPIAFSAVITKLVELGTFNQERAIALPPSTGLLTGREVA
jgi:hypothetical protein